MNHELVSRRRRVPLRLAAQLTVGEGVLDATMRSASGEGAEVLLAPPSSIQLVPGSRATLNVTLPQGAGPLQFEAELSWVRTDATDHRGRPCVAVWLNYRDISSAARLALERLEARARPTLLVVGSLEAPSLGMLEGEFDLRLSAVAQHAWEALDREEIAVGLVGPDLRGEEARAFLAGVKNRFPALATRFLVLAAGDNLSLFQDFVDDDTVFFLTESPVEPQGLLAIARSAATNWARSFQGDQAARLESAQQLSRLRGVLDIAQVLAVQNDMTAVAALAAGAVREMVSAERASCLLYDPREQVLRSKGPQGEERTESAAAGIVSFVARTGLPLRVARAADDSRYDREADDPEGGGSERLLAVPVSEGSAGGVLAVIVAVRKDSQPEFETRDAEALGFLARQVGSVLGRLVLHGELERAAADADRSLSSPATEIYREEALRHHVGAGESGDVLRLSGRWMGWSYRLIALSALAALVYLWSGHVYQHATGMAVVRMEPRLDISIDTAGTVTRVEVQPGQRVTAGQVLVRLSDSQEKAVEPQERPIRAPQDGIVSDVRVSVGQLLPPGDRLLTLVSDAHVVALMPGNLLPKLRSGLPLWITLSGFPTSPQRLTVESVADEVVGREESQRSVGTRVAAEMLPPGPVVVVRAGLSSTSFVAEGQSYRYHDGMVGTAEVQLQSERLLLALVPALKGALRE